MNIYAASGAGWGGMGCGGVECGGAVNPLTQKRSVRYPTGRTSTCCGIVSRSIDVSYGTLQNLDLT